MVERNKKQIVKIDIIHTSIRHLFGIKCDNNGFDAWFILIRKFMVFYWFSGRRRLVFWLWRNQNTSFKAAESHVSTMLYNSSKLFKVALERYALKVILMMKHWVEFDFYSKRTQQMPLSIAPKGANLMLHHCSKHHLSF